MSVRRQFHSFVSRRQKASMYGGDQLTLIASVVACTACTLAFSITIGGRVELGFPVFRLFLQI